MSDLYDQLKEIASDEEGGTLSTLTLMSLPTKVRSIVQLMLRNKGSMLYSAMWAEVSKFPEPKALSESELQEVLDALTRLGWFVPEETEDGDVMYGINLGQRMGSQVRDDKRSKSKEEKEDESEDDKESGGKKRRGFGAAFVRNLWDKVDD